MTCIVATLGPATSTAAGWRDLVRNGVDAFRFTASKASFSELAAQARDVARLTEEGDARPALLVDLPGSKPRLANTTPIDLASVSALVLHAEDTSHVTGEAEADRIAVSGLGPHPRLEVGQILVVGDGEDALEVIESGDRSWVVRPLTTGKIWPRRGVAWPHGSVRNVSLTKRDMTGLAALEDSPFDAAIISFVESAATMLQARAAITPAGGKPAGSKLIAKIETAAGISRLNEIAAVSDAILIGRGDLLLDAGPLELHALIERALSSLPDLPCPLIVGTQLLTSMRTQWLPHRSELAFVCDAMQRGVAGLMLAEETAASDEPLRAVRMLDQLRSRYSNAASPSLFARSETPV